MDLFRALVPEASLPKRATAGSAGYDLRAAAGGVVLPAWLRLLLGNCGPTLVRTGLAWAATPDLMLEIKPRSGLAVKHNVHVVAGVVDSDYRGEIMVALDNRGLLPFSFRAGDRVAQAVIFNIPVFPDAADAADGKPRGAGGFGSTGVH